MEQTGTGFIKISEEVIYKIALTATLETEGVYKINPKKAVSPKKFIDGLKQPKGITYTSGENGLDISVSVTVKFGYKIQEIAENIQNNVSDSIQTMTGIHVNTVNVDITGVVAVK